MTRFIATLALLLYVPCSATAGVVSYQRFEGNLGDSAGGPTGSMMSGSATYSSSVPAAVVPQNGLANGSSLSLASDSIAAYNAPFVFNTPGDATLEFWVNPSRRTNEQDVFWTTTTPGDANRFNIFLGDNIAGGSTFNLDYREPNGTLHPLFNSQQPGGFLVPYALPTDQWTFVAVVRTGSTYSVYFNNQSTPMASVTDINPNLPTAASWTLNGRGVTSPGYGSFVGLVDEIRQSNDALSPSQFLSASAVPEPSSLVSAAVGLVALVGHARRSRSRRRRTP